MRRTLGFALLLLTSAPLSLAQTTSTTRLIPYSGTALNASGGPVAGQAAITFELFEEQEGGAPLWRETHRVQTDERGRYLVYLGAVTPIPQIAFSEERARWLGIAVEGHALARVMLVAVPYALRAADADTLGGQPASSFVRSRADGRLETSAGVVASAAVDGTGVPGQLTKWASPTFLSSSVISESATNRIGVGLPDPTGGGVVDSVFTIRNFDNNTGFAVLNQTQQRRFALNTSANGTWTMYDGFGGTWNPGLFQADGSVGIGGSLLAKLTVTSNTNTGSFVAIMGQALGPGGIAVFGQTSGGGLAGRFIGNVEIAGTLTKSGGSFRIDHPLDPANKVLQHSFVESPDMMNVYNGNVTLDATGEAWVLMPDWFEALNRDFRYQLTAVGVPGPNLYVAAKVSGNRFKIAGGSPGGEVSWQVTGIRQDAWANAHRIAVEEDKPANERGTYLYAKELGRPESTSSPTLKLMRSTAGGSDKPR